MFAYHALVPVNEDTEKLKDLLLRLSRLLFQLTFLAVRGDDELDYLVERELLTEKEKLWLEDATIESRPLVVVNWIFSYFDFLHEKGYNYKMQLLTNVEHLR